MKQHIQPHVFFYLNIDILMFFLKHFLWKADAKEVTTPMCHTEPLLLKDGSTFIDPTHYRKLVGGFQYLYLTRPDISFAENRLSQYMHSPTELHRTTLKRIIRYLKNTIFHGLFLRKGASL